MARAASLTTRSGASLGSRILFMSRSVVLRLARRKLQTVRCTRDARECLPERLVKESALGAGASKGVDDRRSREDPLQQEVASRSPGAPLSLEVVVDPRLGSKGNPLT